MQSIIIYYSFSGNTLKLAGVLAEYLKEKSEVETIELKALDETDSFFGQGARAIRHTRAKIAPVNFDLTQYDLICLGTPVWAFSPAPAMNTYLDNCLGIEGKQIILFTTYGSGMGNERCLNYMQNILAKKGGKNFTRFSIQQVKCKDKKFALSKIKETTRL